MPSTMQPVKTGSLAAGAVVAGLGLASVGQRSSGAFLAPASQPSAAPAVLAAHADAAQIEVPAAGASSSSALASVAAGGVLAALGAVRASKRGGARRTARKSRQSVAVCLAADAGKSQTEARAFVGQRPVAKRAVTSLRAKASVEDLSDADLKGKTVLIRCDLNVPLNGDLEITDETRITSSIPTIEYLCSKGAKVLACSHLGRPKDGPEEKFSLKPVAKRMGELMGKDIKCAPDCKATDEVKEMVGAMGEGDVMILENTRFYKGETKNDPELAESMASLADLFVNDAFGTAHRAHSSTEGVTKFLKPNVSGFLLKKELDYLKGAVDAPVRPMAAIVGGAKVSTKIPVIESMLDKVDKLIIGGGMVFTFLKARGLSVGGSLVEEDMLELATKLEKQAKEKGVELILPSDIACGDAFPGDGQEVGFQVVSADAIPDGWLGLDNGPEATKEIQAALADCKTVIWNGPMGVFESPQFNKGTYAIADTLAEITEKNGAITIIGGGDSVSAVNKSGLAPKMSHISTGGGASLELLEGKVLPGVAALDDADETAATSSTGGLKGVIKGLGSKVKDVFSSLKKRLPGSSDSGVAASSATSPGEVKAAINGFGRIGRNVLRCWLKRETKPFDIVAINVGSMGAKTAAHLLKYDTVLGTLDADVSFTDDTITVDGKVFAVVTGRDPTAMPWAEMGVEMIIESTGAFNSLEGGSKHLESGAKKVVLTAPGKECPTYVVGVNEKDYDPENDVVVSNASCTTNGMASVCKVLDDSFGVEYGLMTTTHSYTGDQMILDGRHRDLRRARAGACNIVPTSTGAAKAVAQVLPKYKGKLNGIALRVPTPNVSIVDLVVKVANKTSTEEVNGALKAAAEGPMEGIINFEEQPLVSSDFKGTDYSNSVDAALTMVMGEDLVKVVMWYDNEWGYSQRVLDLCAIVADKLVTAPADEKELAAA